MIDLNQVLTFTEAAQKWGLASGNSIRQAALRGKFHESEVRKSGTVWLTTYDAMVRVFGVPSQPSFQLSIPNLTKGLQQDRNLQLRQIHESFKNKQQLQITEHILGKERILYLFQHEKDFLQWLKLTEPSFPREDVQK